MTSPVRLAEFSISRDTLDHLIEELERERRIIAADLDTNVRLDRQQISRLCDRRDRLHTAIGLARSLGICLERLAG